MPKYILSLLLIFTLFLSGCLKTSLADEAGHLPVESTLAEPTPPPDETLVISAVGDVMMHNTQILAGRQPGPLPYDYSYFFGEIKEYLTLSDLVIGNLETTLAGEKAGYSGYPRFNAPEILAKNLKDAGFHVLTTANNHIMDKGIKGLFHTLDKLDEAGVLHTGAARSQEERNKILLIEKKGLKIALLAYTYGTNGLFPPKDMPFAVNYLNENQILQDIEKAKKEGAQFIILALHFGQEYKLYPSPEQRRLAQTFFENGADLILGHHPHVLQPLEIYTKEVGGKEKNHLIAYSLGNFISDQVGLERQSSVILKLTLKIKGDTKEPTLQEVSYLPVWTHRHWRDGKTNFQVIPVEKALARVRTGQPVPYTAKAVESLKNSWEHTTKHLKNDHPLIKLERLGEGEGQ